MKRDLHIPFVDIAAAHRAIKVQLMDAISGVMDHGHFILGPEVEAFEHEFALSCGTRYAVGVNSGTDALVLALRALDIGVGDEVITAPNSFVASAASIALVGAKPVFVDVGDDLNIDPELIESAVTGRTRAIIPVHLTGRPAQMNKIMEIAARRGLHVIEDAAQAVLAEYRGSRVGSFGTVACFSFHPLKTLSACGDGGALTTNDERLASRLKELRNIGLKSRADCVEWAGNSRLDTLQAAILSVKMKFVTDWTAGRRRNAVLYRQALEGVDPENLQIPHDRSHEYAVYHTYVIQASRRDDLATFLANRGIGTAVHYPVPIHLQTAARSLGCREGSFPVAEKQAGRILSLPVYPELSEDQVNYVAQSVKDFYAE